MKLLFGLALVLASLPAICQVSQPVGNTSEKAKAVMGTGKVTGIVTDQANGQRIPFASIALISATDSTIKGGGITNDNGEFSIEKISNGTYKARISFLGYSHFFTNTFQVTEGSNVKLGSIKLSQAGRMLKEVQVQGERPFMKLDIDKKTYSAEKMIVAQGGSASDILQQVPSISVDIDGNISMRGSGSINVLIDGKPSGITGTSRAAILDQIPANTIESVEVITNPSAQYDPDGAAGIINIILKKNRKDGSNGNIQLGVGTRDKYNFGISAAKRVGKLSYNANYGLRLNHRWTNGWNWRDTYLKNSAGKDTSFHLDQTTAGGMQANTNQFRLGLDYELTKRDKLSFSALNLLSNNWRNEKVYYNFFDQSNTESAKVIRYGVSNSTGQQFDYRLGYSRSYEKPGKELSGSVNFTSNSNSDLGKYETSSTGQTSTLGISNGQNTTTEGYMSILTSQIDYVNPMQGGGKFEAGAKQIARDITNDYHSESLRADNKFYNDDSISNKIRFQEQIQSGYVQYGNPSGQVKYQVGLRAEITPLKLVQETTGQTFTRTLYNFFPSLSVGRKITDKQEIAFSFSRRIDRPGIQMLNPFPDYADPVNLRIGNPKLLPEYINSYELSHNISNERLTIVTTGFYRSSKNTVNRIRYVDETGKGTITLQNLASSISYGGELIVRNDFAKWFNMNSSGSISNNTVQGTTTVGDLKNTNWTWMVKSQANIKPARGTDIQLSYNYRARNVNVQGTVGPFHNFDIGVRQELFGSRANLALNFTDIFNTMQFRLINFGSNFNAEAVRKSESRVAMLTFTWRFGSSSPDAPKKGKQGDEMNMGGGGEM